MRHNKGERGFRGREKVMGTGRRPVDTGSSGHTSWISQKQHSHNSVGESGNRLPWGKMNKQSQREQLLKYQGGGGQLPGVPERDFGGGRPLRK